MSDTAKKGLRVTVRFTAEEIEVYRSLLLDGESISEFVRRACWIQARATKRSENIRAGKLARRDAQGALRECVILGKHMGRSWAEIAKDAAGRGYNISVHQVKELHKFFENGPKRVSDLDMQAVLKKIGVKVE